MTKSILITGGQERPNGFELGDGKFYYAAKLLQLNLDSGSVETLITLTEKDVLDSPGYPVEYPNLQFTAGCVEGRHLWLCTDTEIRRYDWPELTVNQIISHRCFQNIHSVAVINNELVVTSTGLDMVVVMSPQDGEIKRIYQTEGKDVWYRFSPEIDYRKVHSTRPHHSHPNYVFTIDNELWVTRCTQEDAVCLNDVEQRIDVSGPDKDISVHDGHRVGDQVWFTTVDGFLVIADAKSKKVIERIDFNQINDCGYSKGWCRGILPDGDLVHVAFSRLRKTRTKSRLSWLQKFVETAPEDIGACVITYDIVKKRKVREYSLPLDSLDAVYSLLPIPE